MWVGVSFWFVLEVMLDGGKNCGWIRFEGNCGFVRLEKLSDGYGKRVIGLRNEGVV